MGTLVLTGLMIFTGLVVGLVVWGSVYYYFRCRLNAAGIIIEKLMKENAAREESVTVGMTTADRKKSCRVTPGAPEITPEEQALLGSID